MTIGKFWAGVTVLATVYNGRVIQGPMSSNWAKRTALTFTDKWSLGLACRMELANSLDFTELDKAARDLGIHTYRYTDQATLITLEPTQ